MSEAEKQWRDMRDEYIRQIEAELTAVHHPRKKELVADVRDHLDRKYNDLPQSDRTGRRFRRIFEEMGPAEEYAELLKASPSKTNMEFHLPRGRWVVLEYVLAVIFIMVLMGIILYLFSGRASMQAHQAEKNPQVMQNFQSDPNLVGRWVSVDLVTKPELFMPGKRIWRGDLYLREMIFYDDGRTDKAWLWSKGKLVNPVEQDESRYLIKTIEGREYLFMEWMPGKDPKTGNSPWYVLEKEKNRGTGQ